MLAYDVVNVCGYRFQIGEGDMYGPVFTIEVSPNRFEGARTVFAAGDELGFCSGIYASEDMVRAINEARKLIKR